MKIFIIEENGKIMSVESFKFSDCVEIEVDKDFNVMNIFDYKYEDGKLVELTPEEKEEFYPTEKDEKAEQEATLEQMMAVSARTSFLIELPDIEAAKIPLCYDPWVVDKLYKVGDRVENGGKLWKCRTEHTSQENWKPSIGTASIWEVIDVEHEGTLEDPIPYDQTMTVYQGKYYIEEDIIYKCLRSSGQPLYASCASLVGDYFEKVEE